MGTYTYEGQRHNGKVHRAGTFTFADGHTYEGQWHGGKMHGTGTIRMADGSTYEGQWQGGRPHGTGTVTYADGSTWQNGQWQNGQWQNGRVNLRTALDGTGARPRKRPKLELGGRFATTACGSSGGGDFGAWLTRHGLTEYLLSTAGR